MLLSILLLTLYSHILYFTDAIVLHVSPQASYIHISVQDDTASHAYLSEEPPSL
jgi:hypothetical protein